MELMYFGGVLKGVIDGHMLKLLTNMIVNFLYGVHYLKWNDFKNYKRTKKEIDLKNHGLMEYFNRHSLALYRYVVKFNPQIIFPYPFFFWAFYLRLSLVATHLHGGQKLSEKWSGFIFDIPVRMLADTNITMPFPENSNWKHDMCI